MASKVLNVPKENLFVPGRLGDLSVEYDGKEFSVINSSGLRSSVQIWDLDKELRGVSASTLQKMIKVGYITINESGKEYGLNYNARLKGGLFLSALVGYLGANVVGGAMILAGAALTPMGGLGVTLIAAGTATITAAPFVAATALVAPTP